MGEKTTENFDPFEFGVCPADGNGLADDGVCGFCGCAPTAYVAQPNDVANPVGEQ